MPRTARASVGGICYHVINRGNNQQQVFNADTDYWAFHKLLREACERIPMRVVGYCVMPNHFHAVLWPFGNGDLGRWMQWLLTAHVRRYRRHYGGSGHVWQGRFKAFPIQCDWHLLSVLRYVERNPLRANLVQLSQQWQWSSLSHRQGKNPPSFMHPGPVALPKNWLELVNEPQTQEELESLRQSVNREKPWGGETWVEAIAEQLGLESTLRPRGRPKKKRDKVKK
jgi:putative transposase